MATLFCITKTVENVQITLHQDYQGNARVVIGENFALGLDSTFIAPISHFLSNGWARVSTSNKIHFPQKGAYLGSPRPVEYLALEVRGNDIKTSYRDESGRLVLYHSDKIARIILKEVQRLEQLGIVD